MAIFDDAFQYVLIREGGLVNNKADRGGLTKYGISVNFLKSCGSKYVQAGKTLENVVYNLSIMQAKDIYLNEFWGKARYADIESPIDCNYIFDMAVSSGQANAIRCAQRALYAAYGSASKSIAEDGVLGDITIAGINATRCFFAAMKAERAAYYRSIVLLNPDQKVFLEGWLKRAYEWRN